MRKIVTAFDHAGVDLRDVVIKTAKECGFDVIDVGTDSHTSVDFPDYAYAASQKILDKEAEKGIFVCGSGIGMCLAANKIKGIYAAVCHDYYSAHQAVEHDDINVLCLGSRVIGSEAAHDIITAFLSASFNNKPNQIRRMEKVRKIENGCFELKNNSVRLYECGQSIWLDNIRRGLIRNGQIAKEISNGSIRGITTTPSIFRKAISDSRDYENALIPMAMANVSAADILFQLTVEDIRKATDLFRDLYIKSQGNDGFVSLEVSPLYAHDTEKTIEQARQLWKSVNRPNLMIKIPVTDESIPAITELTAAGINLNLTLIFSPERYTSAANAYIAGLRKRIENGESIDKIRSAASVFISRVDKKIDKILSEIGVSAQSLLGKAAIRNAQRIYNVRERLFDDEHFGEIKSHGGKMQRILWSSTSTKNPLFKPTYYVENLIGTETINTVTPVTLDALQKSCDIKQTLPVPDEEIDDYFIALENAGISLNDVYTQLEEEGIETYANDYNLTLEYIKNRCQDIRKNQKNLQDQIQETFEKFDHESIMRRIYTKDPTVWTFNTSAYPEIRSRLGWLDTYKTTETAIPEFLSLRNDLKKEGISKILLFGMGGSSLAAEVIADLFEKDTDIKLQILDTSDPLQIAEARRKHNPKETLFIAASKSGTTTEVKMLLEYFMAEAKESLGDIAAEHFIAITDPGTSLEKTARDYGFRRIFLSDITTGGRFSALTPFGILPAILMGLDPQKISSKVYAMMQNCSPSLPFNRNEGAALGTFIGIAAANGRDKLTILTDPEFTPFGSWLEQLIAESSGKEGKGIIPVDREPDLIGKTYSNDRAFVYINLNNSLSEKIAKIKSSGIPVFEIFVDDCYDIFSEFYRWEIAIAVACAILNVNAFDQPNVQESKGLTAARIDEYQAKGFIEDFPAVWQDENSDVCTVNDEINLTGCSNCDEIINSFVSGAEPGKNYIAVNAYFPRNTETETWLQQLRSAILHSTNCATTLGFGPRFQHSTGQLHKGGTNSGYFIQIVADYDKDIDIPNTNLTFKTLERAQSMADLESLKANGRKAIRIRFKNGLPSRG